jgi:hypothetical protein
VCVIRAEYGNPNELVDLFLDLTRGCRIPSRSVVLVGSVTHLAYVSLGAYAEDICKAASKIGRIFQGGLVTLPGLVFLPQQVSGPMLVNNYSFCKGGKKMWQN